MIRADRKGVVLPAHRARLKAGYWPTWWLFALAHIPLGWMMKQWPAIATFHAFIILVAGFWFVARDKHPDRVLYVCGYIAGAEVLWRMTDAGVFWEFGKYSLAILSLVAVLRWHGRLFFSPILYFLLLTPSIVIPFLELPWSLARRAVSFNLSAALAMSLFMLFTRNLAISVEQFRTLMKSVIAPIMAIASIALLSLLIHSNIHFTNESSPLASGGYGPNQVSAVLGLGALACWILFFVPAGSKHRGQRGYLFLISWFISHALLTFSRGGVVNFIAGWLVSLFHGKSNKLKQVIIAGILMAAFLTLIFPYLNQFTGGVLEARLRDLDPTNRDEYVRVDLELWRRHPLFGVGAGMAPLSRADYLGIQASTHTEFTRLLAEHGLFGLCALLLLAYIAWDAYRRAEPAVSKALALIFLAWVAVEMAHSATRIAAIPFCFGVMVLAGGLTPVQNVNDQSHSSFPSGLGSPGNRGVAIGPRSRLPGLLSSGKHLSG